MPGLRLCLRAWPPQPLMAFPPIAQSFCRGRCHGNVRRAAVCASAVRRRPPQLLSGGVAAAAHGFFQAGAGPSAPPDISAAAACLPAAAAGAGEAIEDVSTRRPRSRRVSHARACVRGSSGGRRGARWGWACAHRDRAGATVRSLAPPRRALRVGRASLGARCGVYI
jgi:hypothetical protein